MDNLDPSNSSFTDGGDVTVSRGGEGRGAAGVGVLSAGSALGAGVEEAGDGVLHPLVSARA